MSMDKRGRLVDHHEFDIWRYENDSIDLDCRRSECDVNLNTAYMEAMVIARSLGEDLNEAEEVCTVKIYDSGLASTSYRERDEVLSWARFRWLKDRLHSGGYGGVIGHPKPPEWLMLPLWAVEYLASVSMRQWGILTGRLESMHEHKERVMMDSGTPAVPPERDSQGSNVVPFPGNTRPRA